MQITSLKKWLDEKLDSIDTNDSNVLNIHPYQVRFGCVKMCAPRHERFDNFRDIGSNLIEKVLNGEHIDQENLVFIFPERHMGVHEQRAFMYNLSQNPNVENIKSVDIISSSPIMVSDFAKEQIRILTWDDDYKHDGQLTK